MRRADGPNTAAASSAALVSQRTAVTLAPQEPPATASKKPTMVHTQTGYHHQLMTKLTINYLAILVNKISNIEPYIRCKKSERPAEPITSCRRCNKKSVEGAEEGLVPVGGVLHRPVRPMRWTCLTPCPTSHSALMVPSAPRPPVMAHASFGCCCCCCCCLS